MRRLIWVPILHTAADLGSAAAMTAERHGQDQWRKLQQRLDRGWDTVERKIRALALDLRRTRIYQDGLPVTGGPVLQVVTDLAQRGSRNHQLILTLVAAGAALEPTEDLELLRAELQLLQDAKGPASPARSRQILADRDRYIAQRVSATLLEGETGLLFLGALHNVRPWLGPGTELRRLDIAW